MTYTKPEQSVVDGFAKRFSALTSEIDSGDSHKTLGARFSVSDTTIHKWKAGKSMPKIENACLIALHYEVAVEWLLTGRGDRAIKNSETELDKVMSALSDEYQGKVLDSARAYQALAKQDT